MRKSSYSAIGAIGLAMVGGILIASPANAATGLSTDIVPGNTSSYSVDFKSVQGEYMGFVAPTGAKIQAPTTSYKCFSDLGTTPVKPGEWYSKVTCGWNGYQNNAFSKYTVPVKLDDTVAVGTVQTNGDAYYNGTANGNVAVHVYSLGYKAVPAPLTASIVSVDHEERSTLIGGTAAPGATITVKGPQGNVTTTVGTDGKWTATVPGLAEGENKLPVTQTIGGTTSDPITLTVIINPLETPVANPMIAGGAGMLALIGAGIAFTRRKRAQA